MAQNSNNNLPAPQSYEQILSDALSAYAAKVGINDFNVGSAVTSFFEVVALTTARASGDVFQILRDFSVDRATGDALQRLATENNVIPITASPATGFVSAIDTSFQKISTNVYAGLPAPNVGSTVIAVGDASDFTASGAIYIGRGTPNVEGPLAYATPPVQVGNFWNITLSVPTTKFHNLGESVILAQGGNRSIPVGAIVSAPAIGANPDVQYSVNQSAIILDGETTVSNIPVTALLPGSDGNVPIGAITAFASPPFSGATVSNPLAFTTGTDTETDDELRVRIKRALASTGLGTKTAVEAAVDGASTSGPPAATVASTDLIEASYGAVLFIDNGAGYEATSTGVGLESIVDSALGGEQFFQLACGGNQAPVAKAFLQTTIGVPFDLIGGDSLAVVVGGQTYQHTFQTSDFRSPGAATAYEITTSINADTTLGFEATTAGGGTYVVIRSKNEGRDSVQITTPVTVGRDAAVQMGFSSGQIDTLRLYKNNIPLSKDGNTATVSTQLQELWSASIANGDTLILSVDNTAPITYTFTDADFIATGLYNTVSNTNSLESWVEVFNNKLTGVTAEVVGSQIEITSNLGASNRANVTIDLTSTLVAKGMFTALIGLSSQGTASDYTLSRNTAQFELAVPLVAGDKLTAGSIQTAAEIESGQISAGSVTLSADGYFWMLIDDSGEIIPNGVAATTLLGLSKPATNTIRYTSNVPSAFSNVLVGDYVIVWSPDFVASNRFEGRVHAVTNTTLDIVVTAAEFAAAVVVTNVNFTNGFVTVRCSEAPQKFKMVAGTSTLDQIAAYLQTQSDEVVFSTFQEEFLVITSNTLDTSGSLMVVTADSQGLLLDFPEGEQKNSSQSLIAFYDSQQTDAQQPLFLHSQMGGDSSAQPPDSFITSFTSAISLAAHDPNDLISFLHPYGLIRDAQPYGDFVQETSVTGGTTIGITQKATVRRLRSALDRFYLASPLNFGPNDTAVAIIDNNPTSESFEIPLFRVATTNTAIASNTNTFNATDTAAGGTNFSSSFGSTFDFSNFKVLMQAKNVLQPAPANTAILYRSAPWGRSGEKVRISYVYPSVANSAVGSTVTNDQFVHININLASGVTVSTGITAATGWNITVTANTPSAGIDQVTYTWNGSGPSPAFTLSGGEYVNIGQNTNFPLADTGIFRVSTQGGFTPTATSFSVQMPTGVAVAASNVSTNVNGAIAFYAASPTTANQIVTYVNANLSAYVTASLANWLVSNNGTGVVVLGTYEDSGFTAPYKQLQDGLNWLSVSNVSGSPQFTFKNALTLPTAFGYAFNNQEAIRFSPTTMEQVSRFISVLAVTGFTTLGNVTLVERGSKIQLATDTIGSVGSIQIVGGLANEFEVPILDSAVRIDNTIMSASANNVAAAGVNSGQWFKLVASITQAKETLLSTNTSATIVSGSPTAGQSTISLLNRSLTQRYFGKPRHHIRPQGRTFRVEKQGSMVCLSYDPNTSTSPVFNKASLNFNDTGGGTVNSFKVTGSSYVQFTILTGNANFNELSIGDLVTIAGMPNTANNGTFLVVGVSDDGKNMQVLNASGANQFSHGTYTLNTNLADGDTFTIGASTLTARTSPSLAGDFQIGGTNLISAINLSAAISTLSGVTSAVSGNVVTVTAATPSASIAFSKVSTHVTINPGGGFLVGDSFVAGNFSASSSVSEGDTVSIGAPFNVLNQGQFRVIRRFNDSIWFENSNVVEEEVVLPLNNIALGFDATTSFNVNATNHTQYLSWNGSGTEPHLENAQMGDLISFGTDFASANRGTFMVLRSGVKLQEIANLNMPAGSQFPVSGTGLYFDLNSAGNVNLYRVWFDVSAGNSAPGAGGRTLVHVPITAAMTAQQVALAAQALINPLNTSLDFTSSATNGVLTITTQGFQATTAPVNGTMPSPFSVLEVQAGRRTFLECVNPSAVNDAAVLVSSSTMIDDRPQIVFYEYDATVPGDKVNITNAAFLTSNIGAWTVLRVIDRDNAIVVGNLGSITNVSLNGIVSSLFVEEGNAYTGFKQVLYTASQPGAPTRTLIAFTTNAQSDKINQSAGVQMVSQNKMNYSTLIKNGLDSYRYNTGLIQEANRIIYGDPRDSITYPGVGAAGAEIFVREPLIRRIQVALAIRLNTGVPFASTAQQVQNSVTSLVNSTKLGTAIAISSIIAAVSVIPGIVAVSISFPQYDVNDDVIVLAPGEKALIIDPTVDVSVTQVGT